jgi:2,5-furandicarboxylate decarboxylase 1
VCPPNAGTCTWRLTHLLIALARAVVAQTIDAAALVFELDQASKTPVVVFENVRGNGMQLIINVADNRKLLAACLGVDAADLPTAFREQD